MLEILFELTDRLWNMFLGSHLRHSPLYITCMVLIAYVIYRRRAMTGGFVKWLFPKSMYFSASSLLDLKIFVTTRALGIIGFFGMLSISAQTASSVSGFLSDGEISGTINPILITLLLLLTSDFATYWVHRLHHELHWLWPFHSVHHSAETMTPLTLYRKHPIYDMLGRFVHSGLLGLLQGILLGLFVGEMSMIKIAGINGAYFLFNIVGANFRHSHVWVSYGRVLEHIFISPAQHQIHHSIEVRHHNKNYGEVLAIWDLMFGTLYVPKKMEIIQFGLGDKDGNLLPQRHNTLTEAMVVPVQDSISVIKKKLTKRRVAASKPVAES